MNIYALNNAKRVWDSLKSTERARSLAATYFAPAKLSLNNTQDNSYKKEGIEAVIQGACETAYCNQWEQWLQRFPEKNTCLFSAALNSRLLVNMAGSILENAGISLEHISGIPIIPGSAVKGAARRFAIALLHDSAPEDKEELLQLILRIFGCSESDFNSDSDISMAMRWTQEQARQASKNTAGKVSFLQAVPDKVPALCMDVLTPHHSKYMSGKQNKPSDDELPIPSFFPAVNCTPAVRYTFALYAPCEPDLLQTAREWLVQALDLYGIGAKSAAGYGLFCDVQDITLDSSLQDYTPEELDAIRNINKKDKIEQAFSDFLKDLKKRPLWCWALLRAIALPAEDPCCRAEAYRKFIQNPPADKDALKKWKKIQAAMQQLATEKSIKLPS